jgi:hypothetical protein
LLTEPPCASLGAVSKPEPVRVVLVLEPDEHTISGRISVNDDAGPDFYGWLELIDRLEQAKDGGLAHTGEPCHGQ